MTLIIGGAGQGKLRYALERSGLDASRVCESPAEDRPILNHLETWLKTEEHPLPILETYLAKCPDAVILCDEVGCGVVPIDPDQRAWREDVGRLCCRLAKRAERVERIFCGLPMTLKGDKPWN